MASRSPNLMRPTRPRARASACWGSAATLMPRSSSITFSSARLRIDKGMMNSPIVATFSIVARDPRNGDLGIAVASKFLAVGAVVPWARAGAGAVATQAMANLAYGPDGLALLGQGRSAQETLDELLAHDEQHDHRQIGIVDARGGAAAHTGAQCMDWAGHIVGAGFATQGNILAGAGVVEAIAEAFTHTAGELAERLLAALAA